MTDIRVHGTEDLILSRCQLTKATNQCNPNGTFRRNRKIHRNIHMDSQGNQMAKTTLKRKNKVGGLIPSDSEICYKAMVIKTV